MSSRAARIKATTSEPRQIDPNELESARRREWAVAPLSWQQQQLNGDSSVWKYQAAAVPAAVTWTTFLITCA
jgi:hypothetical protein